MSRKVLEEGRNLGFPKYKGQNSKPHPSLPPSKSFPTWKMKEYPITNQLLKMLEQRIRAGAGFRVKIQDSKDQGYRQLLL